MPNGEYSLRLQKNTGEVEYLIGGVINDAVINPWSNIQIPDFD
jgi:hypothetical protein